jgi:hypothetical protein
MTKQFSSGGTKDIGPQHQRPGGGGPGSRGPARVTTGKKMTTTTPFAKRKTDAPAKPKSTTYVPLNQRTQKDRETKGQTFDTSGSMVTASNQMSETFKPSEKTTVPTAIDYTSSLAIGGAGIDQSALLTGGLKAQFDALGEASGPARKNYHWKDLGAPQNPNEAIDFLSQATQSPANDVYTMEITPEMFHQADMAIENNLLTGTDLQWANDLRRQYQFGGPTAYIYEGKILNHSDDVDMIADYDRIQQFKAIALNMVEGERQMKQDFVYGAVAHGQDMALQGSRNIGSAEAARIAAQSAEQTARISAQSAIETQTLAGEQALAQIAAGAEEERATGRALEEARGGEARKTARVTGEEQRKGYAAAGTEERKTQRERAAQQMEQLTAELQSRERIIRTQGEQALANIDREMAAQGVLLEMSQTGDMALQQNRQEHLAEENNKNRAIQYGDLAEVVRSNMAQEDIKRREIVLKQEQNNITNLITIAKNPALLFHLNETGILPGLVGTSIQGESLAGMIGDLTATLDPNKPLPSIQSYNSLSPVMQQYADWQAGATRGFGEGGMQAYLRGASPFTRGQETQIRPGSSRSPFSQGVI